MPLPLAMPMAAATLASFRTKSIPPTDSDCYLGVAGMRLQLEEAGSTMVPLFLQPQVDSVKAASEPVSLTLRSVHRLQYIVRLATRRVKKLRLSETYPEYVLMAVDADGVASHVDMSNQQFGELLQELPDETMLCVAGHPGQKRPSRELGAIASVMRPVSRAIQNDRVCP